MPSVMPSIIHTLYFKQGRSLATASLHFVLLDTIHMILEMLFQPFIVLAANKQSFERVLRESCHFRAPNQERLEWILPLLHAILSLMSSRVLSCSLEIVSVLGDSLLQDLQQCKFLM